MIKPTENIPMNMFLSSDHLKGQMEKSVSKSTVKAEYTVTAKVCKEVL